MQNPVVTVLTFLEEIEQKATHLCRGSGAAGEDNEGFCSLGRTESLLPLLSSV
jgi:hypothetical protein